MSGLTAVREGWVEAQMPEPPLDVPHVVKPTTSLVNIVTSRHITDSAVTTLWCAMCDSREFSAWLAADSLALMVAKLISPRGSKD